MALESIINTFVFGVEVMSLSEKNLFDYSEGIFIEAFFKKHLGPSPPYWQWVFHHSKRNLRGLMKNLVAFSQLSFFLQKEGVLNPDIW